jgi:hypothetical protein
MSVLQVAATTAVLLLLVFGPGLVLTRLLGLRGLAGVALAPALSCALVGLGGVAAPVAEVSWSVWVLLALTVVAGLAAYGAGRLLPASRRESDRTTRSAVQGWFLGAAVVVAGFAASLGSPWAVAAQPDATYHLNSIRSMVQTGDISSRDGGAFLYGRVHSFYPSTFHGIAATAVQLTHQQPVLVANLLAIVAAAAVWVAGCLLLCRQVHGAHGRVLVLGGLAAAAFTAMPYWMAGYGPLWPYLLGLALVPGLLGCLLSLLGLARDDAVGRARAAVVLVVGAAGLGLVHPHAVSALALVSYLALVVAAVQRVVGGRRSDRPAAGDVLLALAAVAGPLLLWWGASRTATIRGMRRTYARGPEESLGRAVGEALLNDPRYAAPLWVTSALVLLGLVVCARQRSTRWLPVAYAGLALVLVAVEAVQSPFTRSLTVFWYNDPPRLGAVLPLVGVPALAAGLDVLWRRRTIALVVVVYLVATLGDNQAAHVARLKPFYRPVVADRALLTGPEASALERLAGSVPAGAIVAGNPWRGHALLYAFTGRKVLFYSEKAVTTPDRELLADSLSLAASRPDVCVAVRRTGVGYVVTGGANQLPNLASRNAFTGIDQVPGRPGFQQVATAAPYTLWRITACGGSG